jgi:diguanylate cyclase (GGDEF)-like protein
MPRTADPHRRVRRSGDSVGSLLLRTAVPGAYCAALLSDFYSPERAFRLGPLAVLAGFTGHFLWRIHRLLTRPPASDVARVELGLLAALALSTVLQVTSAPPFWQTAANGVLFVGLATSVPFPAILVLPLASTTILLSRPDQPWLTHLGFLEALAATAGAVALIEQRRRGKLEVALRKLNLDTEHLESQGRGASRSSAPGDLSKLDDILYDYLQQVKENAGAHGAVLAVKTPKGGLFVRELVSDSHNIREKGILDLEGTTFAWVARSEKPLYVARLRDPSSRLGYYSGNVAIQSFLGVPVFNRTMVEGVLAVDSLKENAFTEAHTIMLKVAAHQVGTILTQIHALEGMKRESRDWRVLHEFSKQVGACGAMAELLDLLLATLRSRVQPDFSTVALLGTDKRLSIQALGDPTWAPLRGRSFDPNQGLAGWVLSSHQYLHYDEGRQRARRPLLAPDVQLPDFQSLLLHPLEAHGKRLGILCLGCRAARAFDQSAITFCEVLAQQGAQAILQLQILEQLTTQASTDELTALANRRCFMERLSDEISRTRRYGHGLTVLLLDVDHFKKVNDVHGHSAGDEVLRCIARTLTTYARESDLVARYGGEEFAALLPSTEESGARALAERVRAGIETLALEWEGRPIPVRASLGVASLRETDTLGVLLSRADQALYAAKEAGRNRVVAYSTIEPHSPPR